jgi:hypothetical protein
VSTFVHDDTLTYDARGKLLTLKGVTETAQNTYTGFGYVSYVKHQDFRTAMPAQWGLITDESFGTDGLGNVTSIDRDPGTKSSTTSYTFYAQTGRLRGALNSVSTTTGRDTSIYDPAGNLTTFRHNYFKIRTGVPPDSVWLAVHDSSAFVYRADQKLTDFYRSVPEANVQDFTSEEVGVSEVYRYDALGRRVLSKSVRASVADLPGFVQRFIWDGDQLL